LLIALPFDSLDDTITVPKVVKDSIFRTIYVTHHIIIKFSFIWRRNISSDTNTDGI